MPELVLEPPPTSSRIQGTYPSYTKRCAHAFSRSQTQEHCHTKSPVSRTEATRTLWLFTKDANCSGMVMSPVHQVWPEPSCKAQ